MARTLEVKIKADTSEVDQLIASIQAKLTILGLVVALAGIEEFAANTGQYEIADLARRALEFARA